MTDGDTFLYHNTTYKGVTIIDLHNIRKITLQICTTLPITSSLIYQVYQIGLAEGHPSPLTFYYIKDNNVGGYYKNISIIQVTLYYSGGLVEL